MKKYQNDFSATFQNAEEFFDFIKGVKKEWIETPVSLVTYLPWAYCNEADMAVSEEVGKDAYLNKEMAVCINGKAYPIRFEGVAQKTLLERNRMTGKAMSDMGVARRCECLNFAKELYPKDLMKVLIQEDKASAFLSGGERDYAILDAYELILAIQNELDDRFDGAQFADGYFDHTRTYAEWKMPRQKEELVGSYLNMLRLLGKDRLAEKLVPGFSFSTSDIGIGKASISAYLFTDDGTRILIGQGMEVKHRSGATVEDFASAVTGMFAMFNDFAEGLKKLHSIKLNYPVNAMTGVCKKLLLPKKAAVDAIEMFRDINGAGAATAGDVYLAMQEILFSVKRDTPSKQFVCEEQVAKALKINWVSFDVPGEIKW